MAEIVMYTKSWCPYCDRAKSLLREKGQAWTEIDVEAQPEKRDEMVQRSGRTTVPQIWIGDRHVGGFDDLADLERRGELDPLLGRKKDAAGEAEHVKVLIIGSGPAGYTAAIYAGRAELQPVMLAGLQFGGQLMLTTDVENYPGFPASVAGPEMMDLFQNQAERFGTTVVLEDLDSGDEVTYRIVGEDEADVSRGLLSVTSPVARALIGKRVEDQVRVVVPKGKREYEVRKIRFDA